MIRSQLDRYPFILTDPFIQVKFSDICHQTGEIEVLSSCFGCCTATVVVSIWGTATTRLLLRGTASTEGWIRCTAIWRLLAIIPAIFVLGGLFWQGVDIHIEVIIGVLDHDILRVV